MFAMELDGRKQKILQAVVQSFILTGKPIGSRAIAGSYDLGISTATIRNEMALLEQMGYLHQPHTSAGRIPTDLAYRYYVDALMGLPKPSPREAKAVERLFRARSREIEEMLREVSLLLSSLTHTTAMVFAPFAHGDSIRNVDLVRLSEHRVMLIVITARGEVGRRLIGLSSPVAGDTVGRVARLLNGALAGRVFEEIDEKAVTESSRFGEAGMELLSSSLESVREYLGSIEERVFIGGTANLVREMDDAGVEFVQALLDVMERQYLILDLLKGLIREERLTVRIGEENLLSELQKCSFVGTSYRFGQEAMGSLGVVGPVCMDYGRTIGMVEYIARTLGRSLSSEDE